MHTRTHAPDQVSTIPLTLLQASGLLRNDGKMVNPRYHTRPPPFTKRFLLMLTHTKGPHLRQEDEARKWLRA